MDGHIFNWGGGGRVPSSSVLSSFYSQQQDHWARLRSGGLNVRGIVPHTLFEYPYTSLHLGYPK